MSDQLHDTPAEPAAHGSLKSYIFGFTLSCILTAIPFWLVMTKASGSSHLMVIAIVILAVMQIIVHIYCFMHVNAKAQDGWIMMSFIFTVVMVLIVLMGSVWVMYNLNNNMMPMTAHEANQMP